MKEYIKPELEVISLVADEAITNSVEGGIPEIEASAGIGPNPFL